MKRTLVLGLLSAAASSCHSATPVTAPALAISPATVAVLTGGTQEFSPLFTGMSDTPVVWSIAEGSAGGTISATGLYSAPAAPGLFHIVATSASDPKLTATAVASIVPVQAPGVALVLSPASLTVTPGAQQQFTATSSGADSAVWWTIKEQGGGVITSNGLYTAPITPGVFHVVATSLIDNTQSTEAAVTVAGVGGVTVQAGPLDTLVASGATQQFTANVAGASDGSVVWSVLESTGGTITADGLYTAPATSGIYHVVATSNANPLSSAQLAVTVPYPTSGPTLSGNISYSGSATGRIYVMIQGSQGQPPGSSIAAPGSYVVRGVQNGTVTAFAFMDTVGTGTYLPTADPSGSVPVTFNNGPQTANLTLTDPAPAAPAAPSAVSVSPSADAAALTWNLPPDSNGNELADHFRIHWAAATGARCPASLGSSTTMPNSQSLFLSLVTGADIGFVSGLVPGSSYCFAVSAVAGDKEGPLSAVKGPVVIRAPTNGATITGMVVAPPSSTSSVLYVAVASPTAVYFDRIANPAANQPFTITGVPSGEYRLPVFLDMDGNGHADATDPNNFAFTTLSSITGPLRLHVTGDLAGQNVLLPTWNALTTVMANYSPNGNYGVAGSQNLPYVYSLSVQVRSNLKLPVAAAILAGAGDSYPTDINVSMDQGKGGFFTIGIGTKSPLTPVVGQTFAISVTYADGTSELVNPSVTGVISALPTTIEPVGTIATTTPVFTWSPPAEMPATYTYCVEISPWNAGPIWTQNGISSQSPTVGFNENGFALAPIQNGVTYTWGVGVVDPYGNTCLDYGMPVTVQE